MFQGFAKIVFEFEIVIDEPLRNEVGRVPAFPRGEDGWGSVSAREIETGAQQAKAVVLGIARIGDFLPRKALMWLARSMRGSVGVST